jgi:hypothetical protein
MNKKLATALTLIMGLSFFGIRTTVADTSSSVSYTATQNAGYTGSFTQISFSVNATLTCGVTYTCSNSPPSSTYRLTATPNSALLTVGYHIDSPVGNKEGTNATQFSSQLISGLVGDSPAIPIPFQIAGIGGTLTIIIHGKLIGQNVTVTPQGSANPNAILWTTWTPKDIVIESISSQGTLKMDTLYEVSITASVTMVGLNVASGNSSVKQFSGNTSPTFAVSLPTSPTPTPTPTITPAATPTPTPSPSPSQMPTNTPAPTTSPSQSAIPTYSPSATASPTTQPINTASPEPSPTVPELPTVTLAIALIAVSAGLVVLYKKKH